MRRVALDGRPLAPPRALPDRFALLGLILGAVVIGVSAVALDRSPVIAQVGERPAACPKKVAGMPFSGGAATLNERGSSQVVCSYAGKTRRLVDSAHLIVFWVERGAVDPSISSTLELFCDTGAEAADSRELLSSAADGRDFSHVGERYLYAWWSTGRDWSVKRAGNATRKIVDRLLPRAAVCPGADVGGDPGGATGRSGTGGEGEGDRHVTVLVSGERLAAMRAAGGIGAIIPLVGDEQWAIVVAASDGSDAIREGYLGSSGRVVSIDVTAADADGGEMVAVTVEVLGEADGVEDGAGVAPSGSPSADPTPSPTVAPAGISDPTVAPTAVASPAASPVPEPAATPPSAVSPPPPSVPPSTARPAPTTVTGPDDRAEPGSTSPPTPEPSRAALPERAARILELLPPDAVELLADADGAVSPAVAEALIVIDRFVADLASQDTSSRSAETRIDREDIAALLGILDTEGRITDVELAPGTITLRIDGAPLPVDLTPVVDPVSGLLFFRFSAADIASMRLVAPEAERLPRSATDIIDAIVTDAGLTLVDGWVDTDGITVQARPLDD